MYDDSPENIQKLIMIEVAALGKDLVPDDPKLFSISCLQGGHRRRWLSIAKLIGDNFLADYHAQVFASTKNKEWALHEVCATMIHVILGGATVGFLLSGRVWEIGSHNACVRTHVLGGFDWLGVEEPRVRVLSDDPYVKMVNRHLVLPSEAAMADWMMLQALDSLTLILAELARLSDVPESRCWRPLGGLLHSYCQICSNAYPRQKETIERRTQYVIDSAVRLGVHRRGGTGRL